MSKIFQAGLIGCGGISAAHRAAIDKSPLIQLAACYDVNPAAAAKAAQESGCTTYDSLEGLLDRPGLDFVIICTPPTCHKEIAVAAMTRRLHVLCEKPLTTSVADARLMLDTAREFGVRLIPAFCHRFAGAMRQMIEIIASGELGRPHIVRNQFVCRYDALKGTWFTNRTVSGGGVIIDTLVHSIDIFHALAGYAEQASAVSADFDHFGTDIEDTALINLKSERGVLGSLAGSWSTEVGGALIEVYCRKGTLIFDYNKGNELRVLRPGKKAEVLAVDDAGNRFEHQMEHFIQLIAGQCAEPLVTEEDGLHSVMVIEQCYHPEAEVLAGA